MHTPPTHAVPVLIALGGNEGDVTATFEAVPTALEQHSRVRFNQMSRLYRTLPIGTAAGDPYFNAVLSAETDLPPESLLDLLQHLEQTAGRVRTVHWGPRPLDLDLILYGQEIIQTERLTVPHAACFYRRFVLDPAVEIAADWLHPQLNCTLSAWRDHLLQRPLRLAIAGDEELASYCSTLGNSSGQSAELASDSQPVSEDSLTSPEIEWTQPLPSAGVAVNVDHTARPQKVLELSLEAAALAPLLLIAGQNKVSPPAISLRAPTSANLADRLEYLRQMVKALTDTPRPVT